MITSKKRSGKYQFSKSDLKKLFLAAVFFFGTWMSLNINDVNNFLIGIGIDTETVAVMGSFFVYAFKTFKVNYGDEKKSK